MQGGIGHYLAGTYAQIAPMGGWVLKVPNQLKSGRYLVRNGLKFRKISVKFNVNLLKPGKI